jgi:hypothetical protein
VGRAEGVAIANLLGIVIESEPLHRRHKESLIALFRDVFTLNSLQNAVMQHSEAGEPVSRSIASLLGRHHDAAVSLVQLRLSVLDRRLTAVLLGACALHPSDEELGQLAAIKLATAVSKLNRVKPSLGQKTVSTAAIERAMQVWESPSSPLPVPPLAADGADCVAFDNEAACVSLAGSLAPFCQRLPATPQSLGDGLRIIMSHRLLDAFDVDTLFRCLVYSRKTALAVTLATVFPEIRLQLVTFLAELDSHASASSVKKIVQQFGMPLRAILPYRMAWWRETMATLCHCDNPDLLASLVERWLGREVLFGDHDSAVAWYKAEEHGSRDGKALFAIASAALARVLELETGIDGSSAPPSAASAPASSDSGVHWSVIASDALCESGQLNPARILRSASAAWLLLHGVEHASPSEAVVAVRDAFSGHVLPRAHSLHERLVDAGKAAILIDTPASLVAFVETALAAQPRLPVALDCEWNVDECVTSAAPALVASLAVGTSVAVVDLVGLDKWAAHPARRELNAAWRLFVEQLASPSRYVTGFAVSGDIRVISQSYDWSSLAPLKPADSPTAASGLVVGGGAFVIVPAIHEATGIRLIDLTATKWPAPATAAACTAIGCTEWPKSLSKLVLQATGLALPKFWQVSDWRRRPVQPSKLLYAACDATAVLCVLEALA